MVVVVVVVVVDGGGGNGDLILIWTRNTATKEGRGGNVLCVLCVLLRGDGRLSVW